MSPRVWLYQVPDTSFPVSSFGLSSPFSRLLAKSLKVSHWPRPPVPPPQNLMTLGVWRFCPGPQCTCTLLALHAPWNTDFTQYYKHCSLLLSMHTHMHIHAHTGPEHMHTCVHLYLLECVHTQTHTHTHTRAIPRLLTATQERLGPLGAGTMLYVFVCQDTSTRL